MKLLKAFLIFIVLIGLTAATTAHKFYVSTTNVEYVPQKESIQIITKIFIDDIEDVLQERYAPSISLATKKETKQHAAFLEKYLNEKLTVTVNGKEAELHYLGREYEIDVVKAYIEITGVKELKSIAIENKLLFELFPDQQNIIHFKSGEYRRSLVLEANNPKEMLNFK
ncbi:MAG: hypothetical protein CMC08_04670 [Flavobacteriaceae bacterium]|nr:hypothetical protein [Flavobacteriaceae bacterium]